MGRVRVPWTSQPQQPTGIDPKWINRGLAYVYVGSKLIWSRETVIRPAITYGGGPKIRASQYGWATGFGATYGAGTTDSITGPLLTTGSARGGRSIVAHVYRNGAGGGGIGRIFDAGNTGAGAEFLHNTLTTNTLTYQCYVQSAVAFVSWSSNHVISSGAASVQGISIDLTATGKSASFYQNGAPTGVVAPAGATTGTYGTYTNALVVGNRTSDNARNWDGWIGSILIFDGPPLTGTEHALLAANPWQVFAPLERNSRARAAGGGTTITCTVGNAVANGTTAAITKTIATTVGNAAADGTTASLIHTIAISTGSAAADGITAAINRIIPTTTGDAVAAGITASIVTDSSTTISCTVGNAVADGLTAAVTRTLATTAGNSVADGTTAAVTRGIVTTTGNAVADGSTSAVTRTIATTPGNAAAAGITASIVLDGSVTIACTVGNAVADGTLAAVTRTVATTLGNAVADGLAAGLTRTIATTTGNAVADGITATITTVGQTTISCSPGNAAADGAMATVMRTITADPGNAVANGSIAALLRVIAAGPGNAVADGVAASILGATSIVCTPGNAVAAGVTASIVGGQLGAPAYVYAILAESRSYSTRTEARSQAVAAESRTQNVPATI